MNRSLRAAAAVLAAAASLSACSGGDSTENTVDPRQAFIAALSDYAWTGCTVQGSDSLRETMVLTGSSTFEARAWKYTGNSTCTGRPVIDNNLTGTIVFGNAVSATAPGGTGTVTGYQIDMTLTGGGAMYSIAWIDTAATPAPALYVGDEMATAGLDGSTPGKRPTTLQVDRPRFRGAIPAAASLDGAYWVCRNDNPGTDFDYREVIAISGTSVEVRVYTYGTKNGTCTGRGLLDYLTPGNSFSALLAVGATHEANAGSAIVQATNVDVTSLTGAPPPIYSLVWVDSWATTRSLYLGDTVGPNDGSTILKRHTALQANMPRYAMATPAPFPAILDGTWRNCRYDGGHLHDIREDFVIAGSNLTVTEHDATSTNGSCSTGLVLTSTSSGTFTVGAATTAMMSATATFNVTAYTLDVLGMYSILYVDTYGATQALYVGDEMATAGLDGTAPDKRPTLLQNWKPRYRQ